MLAFHRDELAVAQHEPGIQHFLMGISQCDLVALRLVVQHLNLMTLNSPQIVSKGGEHQRLSQQAAQLPRHGAVALDLYVEPLQQRRDVITDHNRQSDTGIRQFKIRRPRSSDRFIPRLQPTTANPTIESPNESRRSCSQG